MPEVSGIMTLFPTWASREQIPFLLAWSVCLSRTCLKWEWLVSRREELLNLKAPFIWISIKLAFLVFVRPLPHACLPQEWLAYHYLYITEIILLNGEHSRMWGSKEKLPPACLLSISQKKSSYFSLMEKQNQNPRPHHQKSRGCKFSDSNRAVLHYIKIDLWHPRVQDNSWKHTQSQEKWLYNAIWAFHILFSLSLSLSLITLPGWVC